MPQRNIYTNVAVLYRSHNCQCTSMCNWHVSKSQFCDICYLKVRSRKYATKVYTNVAVFYWSQNCQSTSMCNGMFLSRDFSGISCIKAGSMPQRNIQKLQGSIGRIFVSTYQCCLDLWEFLAVDWTKMMATSLLEKN